MRPHKETRLRRLTLFLAGGGLLLLGCNGAPEGASSNALAGKPRSTTPTLEAREILAERCSPCHGADGRGDGPAARECDPKPPNLTDAVRQSHISNDELRRLILLGGKATGRSNQMPPNSDLAQRRETVDALVSLVRGMSAQ